MPYNDTGRHAMLTGGLGNAITHVGVLQSGDPGTGTNFTGTEATGGTPAYARQAVTWAAASGGTRTNSAAITIDVPAGTYSDVLLMNAVTGNTNNYLGYLPINGTVRGYASTDPTLANDALLSAAHGLSNNDRVRVYNVFAESLPTGLVEGTMYHVVNATTDSFKVSLTQGGAAVDITGLGECFWQRVVPETFSGQGQLTIAIGALVLDMTGA